MIWRIVTRTILMILRVTWLQEQSTWTTQLLHEALLPPLVDSPVRLSSGDGGGCSSDHRIHLDQVKLRLVVFIFKFYLFLTLSLLSASPGLSSQT